MKDRKPRTARTGWSSRPYTSPDGLPGLTVRRIQYRAPRKRRSRKARDLAGLPPIRWAEQRRAELGDAGWMRWLIYRI